MKQTPIPEKIKLNSKRVHSYDEVIITFTENFNALIDVLTEQQKEINGLKGCIRSHAIIAHGEMEEPEYCKCRDPFPCHPISEEFNCGKCHACDKPVKVQPYTAMRSTGEQVPYVKNKYCECFYPVKGGVLGSDVCHSCCLPIKPQEDVLENVIKTIQDAVQFNLTWQEIERLAKKILAIVKGE